MSFQSFVTDRLAELTAKFNAIATNAKKIDELAVQNNLDPASKIHVSRGGVSESLSIQKIIDAVASDSYDKLLAIGEITLVDNRATIPANAQWKIADVNYGNIDAIEIPIPYCVTGLSRKDILVANTLNEIILVKGPETAGSIVIAPNIPINTVFITEMDVTDSTVGTPMTPIVGSDYILKQESYDFIVSYYDAVIEQVDLTDHRASLNFMGTNTDVKSIALSGEFMRNGKIFTFKNHNATPLTIWHNSGTGNVKLLFPNEENFVLQPNEVIQFSLNYYDTSIPRLEYIGIISSGGGIGLPIAITDVTGLTEELADRYTKSEVDAKVSSVYKFKGNVANYAALPATGLTIGDVYNLLDTGANYAWTGTVWDKLGDTIDISGKEDLSNKSQDIETDKTSTTKYASAKQLYDWAVAKFQAVLVSGTNIKTINGTSILGSGDITVSAGGAGDMTTTTDQTVSGIKTFLAGKLGFRNVANTFTSFFTNANTASRTYVLQDRDGVLLDNKKIVLSPIDYSLIDFGLIDENTFKMKRTFSGGDRNLDFESISTFGTASVNRYRFRLKNYTDSAVYNALMIETTATNAVAKVTVGGNLVVTGDLTGNFSPSKIVLSPVDVNVLNAGTNNEQLFDLKRSFSGGNRNLDFELSSSFGAASTTRYRFRIKNYNDSALFNALEIETTNVDGVALVKVSGTLKALKHDLSALGAYADDASASVGGVAVGFAYINSTTGAMHRRLT